VQENGYIGNENALKYKTQEELQKGIDKYFKDCDKKKKPYTMTGLAISLGIDRRTLINYGNKDLFFSQIKNAKAKVEEQLEESLYRLGNNSGVIFNLKNNYGWRDSFEINNNDELSKLDELLGEIKKDANK
jgi:hypothetical protein